MPVSRNVVYNNFKGGEYGLLGEENAPAGTFHGKNVIVYANGLIGPRPGLRNYTPAGMPVGRLRTLMITPTPNREALFIILDKVYYCSLQNNSIAPVEMGSGLTNENPPLVAKPDAESFLLAVPGAGGAAGVYRLRQTNGTIQKLSGAPACTNLEIYGSQLILVQDSDHPRLLGSLPSEDGETYDFSGGMFLDVGDNWGVTSILTQNNYLTILKRNSIHIMSGVFGEDSMVVRQVSRSVTTFRPWHSVIDLDDRIWFIPLFRENVATFNGASLQQLTQTNNLAPRVGENGDTPLARGITSFDGQLTSSSVLAVQGADTDRGVLFHNGVTTFHKFETKVSGMMNGLNGLLLLTDGGSDSTASRLLGFRMDYDRPGFVSDFDAQPGDDSTTPLQAEFEMPVWLNQSGRNAGKGVRVRNVTVEIKKWNTGVATNSLTVAVKTLDRPNGAGDVLNASNTWTEAASASSTTGDHDRIVLPLQNAIGNGFQIKISGMVGVAIRSIVVGVEDYNEQPRDE